MRIKKWLSIMCILIMVVFSMFFVGCKDKGSSASGIDRISISLNMSSINMNLYEEETLTATVKGSDEAIVWTTSDEAIVSVQNGVIRANSVGNATVTATIGETSVSCAVRVIETMCFVRVNETTLALNEGDTYAINPLFTINYQDAEVDSWEFLSSDTDVAKVDDGIIKAIGGGSCKISVIANYLGTTWLTEIDVTVLDDDVEFYLGKREVVLSESVDGEYAITEMLDYTLKINGNSIEDAVVWKSENSEIATVENGLITAQKRGEVKIYAQYDEYLAYANVTVLPVRQQRKAEAVFFTAKEEVMFDVTTYQDVVQVEDINGKKMAYTIQDNKLIVEEKLSTGRHLIKVTDFDYVTSVPVVVADIIIRSAEDLDLWHTKIAERGREYVLLASDINYENADYTTTLGRWGGTFDGYGHSVSNITIRPGVVPINDSGTTVAACTFLCSQFSGTIKDFVLENVVYQVKPTLEGGISGAESGLCGRLNDDGVIENCFISGKVNGTCWHTSLMASQIAGQVKNCVVDGSLQGAGDRVKVLGCVVTLDFSRLSNVLVIADVPATISNLEGFDTVSTVSKVSPSGEVEESLKKFVEKTDAWTYDQSTGAFCLGQKTVYGIASRTPASATQFITANDVTLKLDAAVATVMVDGLRVSFVQDKDSVRLWDYSIKGRHTAMIFTNNGKIYNIPFVVADYVIRTATDVENWNKSAVSGITGGALEEYVVLANNIDCTDVVYAPTYTNFYGVFDGYGHALTNLVVGTTNLGGTRTSSSFIGGTLYGSVKDLALVNVHFDLTNGMYDAETGLCGRLERGLIENCYVSGIVTMSGMCRRAGLISALEAGGTVRNCIVDASKQVQFDNFYAVGINGDDATTPYGTTFENVLAIAPAGVLINKADNANITAVSPTDGTATAIQEFITKAGENSAFSFDEATKTLKLWDTAVYSSLDV